MSYKLRCSVFGHSKDVRGLCCAHYPEGGFISASRDVTSRVWVSNQDDPGFTEGHVMNGHNGFVSCVCVMPPDDTYPHGLIMTGSHDNTILAFTLDSPQPVFKLEGHADTVCSLSAGKFGSLLSGSWDSTAKVWLGQKCVMTLKGHEAAVWSVTIMPEGGFMLTGSADKTIRMWRAGKCERTFKGHDDCVRGLAVLSTTEFLSCSNDASVRKWLASTGECIQIYYGHTNYIYSIALLPNGLDFVTSGEDRTLRVWINGQCDQTITHPTQSIWTVCVLPNGDIVTGSSDAMIRVFTTSSERMAGEDVQAAFREEVAAFAIPSQIGGISTDKLPGPQELLNPGKKDGQVLMIRRGTNVEAHQWDAAAGIWNKVGDVTGGSGGSQSTSGKQLYEGKEYDYVFDVDLSEDHPPIKLPYNITEDPWMAAHNFLEKNELSPMFLDQVANFIMEQTKGVTLGAPAPVASDPFTGGSRYVPGAASGRSGNALPQGTSDPFTGQGRYIPSTNSANHVPPGHAQRSSSYNPSSAGDGHQNVINEYFPKKSYLTFDTANIPAMIGKLKEFNNSVEENHKIEASKLLELEKLISEEQTTVMQFDTLWKVLQWPPDKAFPGLDMLRLAIRNEATNQYFFNHAQGTSVINFLLKYLSVESAAVNQMLVLKILSNSFSFTEGRNLLQGLRDGIIESAIKCQISSNKNVHISLSTLMLNYAVTYHLSPDPEAKVQCLTAAVTLSQTEQDPEAIFRYLVCVGTLIWDDPNTIELAKSPELLQFVNRCVNLSEPKKLNTCAKYLEQVLK